MVVVDAKALIVQSLVQCWTWSLSHPSFSPAHGSSQAGTMDCRCDHVENTTQCRFGSLGVLSSLQHPTSLCRHCSTWNWGHGISTRPLPVVPRSAHARPSLPDAAWGSRAVSATSLFGHCRHSRALCTAARAGRRGVRGVIASDTVQRSGRPTSAGALSAARYCEYPGPSCR